MIHTILKTKFENYKPKKSIYRNFIQYHSDQFKLDIFNSMSAMRTHAASKNNFVSILYKHAPKKTNIYEEIKNPISIRTFRSKY